MSDLFVVFWTVMIFISIAWYAFLLFYVGAKGGKEIRAMIKALTSRQETKLEPEDVKLEKDVP